MDEFGMGYEQKFKIAFMNHCSSANLNSFYGPVVNPLSTTLNEALVAGGSSGGSAAAVAAKIGWG
jgi:Asp-tRNA(Asn)/Glu-tRNA(Gln) amidotransferase A subunit family amidase